MKIKGYFIFFVLILTVMYSSCSSEEEMAPAKTIEYNQRQFESSVTTKEKVKFPTLDVYSVTPCGYGFKVKFYYVGTGAMAVGVTKPYEIYNSFGVLVDSGNVTHNGNTNWVLNPCETYVISIDAGPFTGIVTFTVTSDGCGGTFIC